MQNSVICTRMTSLHGFQPSSLVLCMQNSVLSTRIKRLYGFQPSSEVFACKPTTFGPKLHVPMGPRTHLWFSACKTACLASDLLVSMGPSPHLWFLQAKQRLLDPNKTFYGNQTSPVVLCRQYSVISIRKTCLYGSQPLTVVFAGQTVTFGADFKVSMGPRHDLSFCACKTAWLASELLVFMSPSPHVWFLEAKERLLDRINKSLWVPDITCLLCMQNCVISNWITSLSGSQPSSVVFACKKRLLDQNYKSLWVPDLTCPFVHAKQHDLHQNDKSIWFPALISGFVHAKQRL